jgi:hypothetical protein
MRKNKIKNRVIVESFKGDRAFLLLEGDIFIEPADTYVFNTYKNMDMEVSGSLIDRLRDLYQQDEISDTPFYFTKNGVTVNRLQLDKGRNVLLLHSGLFEHENLSLEQYKTFIEIVFTSLTALEAYGERLETIAFPVLLRNGLTSIYRDAIKILVEKATEWLKTSDSTKVIKYVLYEDGDADKWNDHLDHVLGRTVIKVNESSELRQYQNKALSILQRFNPNVAYWNDTLLPIQDALQRKDFRPEVLAAFSRKLLEVYSHDLNEVDGNEASSLEGNLSIIRKKNKELTEWDIQMLYQIRSFGNPSIHRTDQLVGPSTMNEKDVMILLICLCRLLEIVYEFVTNKYTFSII